MDGWRERLEKQKRSEASDGRPKSSVAKVAGLTTLKAGIVSMGQRRAGSCAWHTLGDQILHVGSQGRCDLIKIHIGSHHAWPGGDPGLSFGFGRLWFGGRVVVLAHGRRQGAGLLVSLGRPRLPFVFSAHDMAADELARVGVRLVEGGGHDELDGDGP